MRRKRHIFGHTRLRLIVKYAIDKIEAATGLVPKKLMQAVQPARMPKFSAMLELLREQYPRRLTALDAGQRLSA
jgi:hypothetical protein